MATSKQRDIDLAYLAGIIDGEGTVSIYKGHNTNKYGEDKVYYSIRIYVSGTDARLITWLQDTFGGKVTSRTRKNDKWRDEYKWTLAGVDAVMLLRDVEPLLLLKREQAKIILQSSTEDRESAYNNVKSLNQRGA